MDQIPLGKTGLKISRLGFGGIPIQRCSEDEAVAVVRGCVAAGMNFIDSANAYTTSEARIGKAIAGLPREKLVIATKTNERTREGAEKHLRNSLDKLGTKYIDLYQFHGVNDAENLRQVLDPNGALAVFIDAKRQGVVRHIGITSHSLKTAIDAVKTNWFETVMYGFNFMNPEPALELLPLARERGMGFIAMKPMNGGMLDHPAPALKFLFQYPDILPIIGIENLREMKEIVQILEGSWKLTPADRAEIKRLRAEMGDQFCRRCDYCQPCPQGIKLSTITFIRAMVKRTPPDQAFGPRASALVDMVDNCTECGECEPRCPYQLPVRDMLKEERDWYRAQHRRWQAECAKA